MKSLSKVRKGRFRLYTPTLIIELPASIRVLAGQHIQRPIGEVHFTKFIFKDKVLWNRYKTTFATGLVLEDGIILKSMYYLPYLSPSI